MKRYLVFVLMGLPSYCYALMNPYLFGISTTSAGGDDCSGIVVHSWHMENADVTVGTPAGCSDIDETGVATNGATLSTAITPYDGTYSMLHGIDDYYAFDIPATTAGADSTICTYIYVPDWTVTDYTSVFNISYDAENDINMYWVYDGSAVDFTLKIEGSNDYELRGLNNKDFTGMEDTWLRVCGSWDLNDDAVDSIWFWVDIDADGVVDVGEESENTSCTVGNWAASGTITLKVGGSGDNVYYQDYFYYEAGYNNAPL